MGVDDIHAPPDSPAGAPAPDKAADVTPQHDEGTPGTDVPGDPPMLAAETPSEVPAAARDEATAVTDAAADQPESSRWLMQLHVEGPKSQFGDAKDPDGIRSDNYWMPLGDLVTDDDRLANGTWGELCDRLQIADDDQLRGVFPPGQQVKQWELVAAEHAAPPEWGARTQVTFARVPDNVTVAATTVDPVAYAPWSAGGGIRSFPEPAVQMGSEWSSQQFDSQWIHGTPHEVPELADRAIAEARDAAGGDPMGTVVNLVGAMSDQQFRTKDGVVVTDEAGNPVDFDQRWRDAVPEYDADGRIVTDKAGVPVWRPVADVGPLSDEDDDV